MRCPKCGYTEDKVVDSRIQRSGECIRRRRECLRCGHRFTTREVVVTGDKQVVKHDGRREEFDRQKLRTGVRRACWKRPISIEDIDALVDRVAHRVENLPEREVPSKRIGEFVMEELRALDEVAYVRFASVYRRFKDVDEFVETVRDLAGEMGPDAEGAP